MFHSLQTVHVLTYMATIISIYDLAFAYYAWRYYNLKFMLLLFKNKLKRSYTFSSL